MNQQIDKDRLMVFSNTLEEYRRGKQSIESRIVEAEEFWKLRHWRSIREKNPGEPEPASGWLVNAILSKHSDAVDAYPEALCLPREAQDQEEAKMLSTVLPVILQQNDFAQVWSDVWWYKLKSGTGVYGVFWDPEKNGGLGDISIQKVDILNLFWEPGISHLQDSRYVFHVTLQDNELLEAHYPALAGHLGSASSPLRRYRYDENISTQGKTPVIEVYYKVRGVLHYCKYVEDVVLYATEEDPLLCERGLYDHGLYPFLFDPLFPEEGYPGCGYGYVDLCKDPQKIVDILNNCFVQSAVAASTPRWFVRADGGINEEEYADLTKKFVHVQGRVDADSILQIQTSPMPGNAVEYMQMKINEIKEVSGNRDINNGGATSVTAASAIVALQEAGNGLSRDMIAGSYRTFRHVIELCIELIRQFYDVPRTFRIMGEDGLRFCQYSNAHLRPQSLSMGARVPVFDIEVQIQAESPYSRESANQLAIQLYQLGVFQPQNAAAARGLLQMMDFKGKEKLLEMVEKNTLPLPAPLPPGKAVLSQPPRKEPAYLSRARAQARDGAKPR